MDSRQLSFLRAVVGQDGAKTLSKAVGQSQELADIIFPRVIIAYADLIANGDFQGNLPGLDDTSLVLSKTENGLDYSINFGSEKYDFRGVGINHLAGSMAVALGYMESFLPIRTQRVKKLAKSIELLVKSNVLGELKKDDNKGKNPDATTAKPIKPVGPVKPSNADREPDNDPINVAKRKKPLIPGMLISRQLAMKVTKAESVAVCGVCGNKSFKGNTFIGCKCLETLAKSVKVSKIESGYILRFGDDWDEDSYLTLADALGK